MKNVKKIVYLSFFVTEMGLSSVTSAYIHKITNLSNWRIKVRANTIGGRDKSIEIPSDTTTMLNTEDLCLRGFHIQKLMRRPRFAPMWSNVGYIKTKNVITDQLGEPAIARGCMDYHLTVMKDGSLSLESMDRR